MRLNEVQPEIWRRFDIPSDWTFAQFHEVIQIVMGWTDSHLHEFVVADTRIGPRHSDPPPTVRDETRIKISDMFVRAKQEGLYLYDFGDGWEHSLTLGSVLPLESSTGYPRCLEGERACPPEDCGGPFGFADMMEALRDSVHRGYRQWSEWIGSFDADFFAIDAINQAFAGLARSGKNASDPAHSELSDPLSEAELDKLDELLEMVSRSWFDLPALHESSVTWCG